MRQNEDKLAKALPEHALNRAAASGNIPKFLARAIALGPGLCGVSGRFLAVKVKALRRMSRNAGAYDEEEERDADEERDAADEEEAGAQGAPHRPEEEPTAAAALSADALARSAALADELANLLLSQGHTQWSHAHRQLLRLRHFLLRQQKFLALLEKASTRSCMYNKCIRRRRKP